MPVYSMTGYASVQHILAAADGHNGPGLTLGLEIRSVNSRHLDLMLRLPEALRMHEALLRAHVVRRLQRGKVEVRVGLDVDSAQAPAPGARQLQRLGLWQRAVQEALPRARALSVAEVLRLCAEEAASPLEQARSVDWPGVLPALLERALEAVLAARAHEGQRLADMLLERCTALRQLAARAQSLMPGLLEQQRQRFLQRWHEALASGDGAQGVSAQAAQERALLEAAAHALRADVAEEISRLNAHLDAIETPLRAQEAAGKRLEFLIQELHREANTLGAKSATLEMTRISVDMRVLIEQMREQVQNLE